jgi:effector-binding domain-containing protein
MQCLLEAKDELKRADHLLYVSLKYTRTVDVIRNIVERLINALEFTINDLLEYAKQKKMIAEKPANIGLMGDLLKKTFSDDETILEMVNFFLMLRRISRADYKKSSEYRRHVSMSVILDEIILNISIDKIKEYYDATVKFVEHAEKTILGEAYEEY